jgi:hypothetical protein
MHGALLRAVQPSCPRFGFDRSLFGDFDDFASVHESQRRHVLLETDDLQPGTDLIAGHFAWSTIRQRLPTARLLTILREPQCRLLSHWTYWRAETEDSRQSWGTWAAYASTSHHGFADFLNNPRAACQTDNLALRMVLWPNPLIPAAGFIAAEHEAALLAQAQARLAAIDHVNIVENPHLAANIGAWLCQPVCLGRDNVTPPVPPHTRARLSDELTPPALAAWHRRSRLDFALWSAVCARVMPFADPPAYAMWLRSRALRRYGALLAEA